MWERLIALGVVAVIYGLAILEVLTVGHEARAAGDMRRLGHRIFPRHRRSTPAR